MNLNNQEQIILEAMRNRAGATINADEIEPLAKWSRQHMIMAINRLIKKLADHKIIVERSSKLGRGHKAVYSIPLTIRDV